MLLKKFENPQIKIYINYWENECKPCIFFFLDQSQHTMQHAHKKQQRIFKMFRWSRNKTEDMISLNTEYMIYKSNY